MQQITREKSLAETGTNDVFDIEDHFRTTPYERIYSTLAEADRFALDLREKCEELLVPSSYSRSESMCGHCGEFGSVIGDAGDCRRCWIDDSILQEEKDLAQIVTEFYAGQEIITDDNLDDFAKKYVSYTRELDQTWS